MTSDLDYATTTNIAKRWCEVPRVTPRLQTPEKWLIVGLLGAGVGALTLWVHVMLEMVKDIMLAGAAYFGG